jgi:SAM-dependent methyltransferase
MADGRWPMAFLLRRIPAGCERALEIGCGLGRFTRALAGRVPRVIALDVSEEMLAVARRRAANRAIEFISGDAVDVVPGLGSFDLVISLATFRHLPAESIDLFRNADVIPTMREVRRLASRHLPRAAVHKHFLWRYTLVWHNQPLA